MRLVTPGDVSENAVDPDRVPEPRHGQCHRDYTACDSRPGDSSKENLRDIFFGSLLR